jgi:hypothetical protein
MIMSMLGDQPQIRTLMREAADAAFAEQVASLYKVYLSNPNTTDKQRKATAHGLERAIDAYRVLVSSVEAWNG